eukprot:15364945-Ditylum_brightwellii.AAC.1
MSLTSEENLEDLAEGQMLEWQALENNFIAKNIGSNHKLKYKIFQYFFAVQDPITTPLLKEKCPNYKADSLLRLKRHIWKQAWLLGPNLFANE